MTVLMPSWYYEKKDLKHSPSILDGIDVERENRYRREGARFIINVGTKMGLRYDTMATGVVYFHRFYMFHSFKTFPRYVTACCCLFLAGKVEETPKKCKDIIRIAKTFLADAQFTQFGDDPKEEVMTLERILLQTIKFDLQMDHPYGHLLKYAKSLKGDKVKLQNMVQMAWTFINDSLCTTLCLQFEPEVIAIALMYLAGKLSKFEVVDWVGRTPKHSHWWDMFVEGMSIELLEDICHQVLDLYSTPMSITPQDSPPATPPTKSTRKSSQPPSPVEITASPAQTKPKEAVVGQPIPRLEPGEVKRKASVPETKKELPESKKRRMNEGKMIPIVTSSSPKANNTQSSDTQPSSPTTPVTVESTTKNASKHTELPVQRNTLEPAFRTGISSSANQPTFPQSAPVLPPENISAKSVPSMASIPTTTFSTSVPPPTTTYTQPGPSYYTGVALEKTFPNMQQPPPQIYPLQFQHPPPPGPPPPPPPTPSGPPPPGLHPSSQFADPSHQFPSIPPSGVPPPPFNSQFPPPPRHQPPPLPPNIITNPPPAPIPVITQPPPPRPQGLPPVTDLIRSVPPPSLPSVVRPPRMISDSPFPPRPPGTEMFSPHPESRGGRPPPDHRPPGQDFGPRPHFENNNQAFRGRKELEYDSPYSHEPQFPDFDHGYPRPPPPNQFGQNFERPPRPPPPRRFPLDHRKQERGPRPPMGNNMSQPQGASTGIPPVRITGSM